MAETYQLQSFWRCLKCNYESDSPADFKALIPKATRELTISERKPEKRMVCPSCGLVYDE